MSERTPLPETKWKKLEGTGGKPTSEVEIGEYKGSPTIIIHELDKDGKRKAYPFTFGAKKAKLILAHVEEIESFVAGQP